jgi:hypothetical protein
MRSEVLTTVTSAIDAFSRPRTGPDNAFPYIRATFSVHGLHFDYKNGGSSFLWNVGKDITDYTATHPRNQ